MFVVEHDVGGAVAHAAAGFGFVLVVVHFQFREIGLNLAVVGAGIEAESCLVGQALLDIAVAAIDLHVADRVHADFDCAVVILQADVAGNLVESDVL